VSASEEAVLPKWLARTIALALAAWLLTVAFQMSVMMYWKGANDMVIEQYQRETDRQHEQIEILKIRTDKLEKDYANLKGRIEGRE
jgi:hypothetical protein